MSKFAIVDIETTGGNSSSGKITEISIFLYDGYQIVDEFTTLINPERAIPPFISRLTGITDTMVADAPTFSEIAKRIVEITDEAVFVAHNVSFDYNFIRGEFASLGYDYNRKTICTVTASRRYLPGYKSYSLGNICADLGIEITDRHRARGDAFATVALFQICLSKGLPVNGVDEKPLTVKERVYSTLFDVKLLTTIPSKTGIYYFYNSKNDLIYIGKSKNLKRRIPSHFVQSGSSKGGKIKNTTASFDCFLTGSELIALLLESEEINSNKPELNKTRRKLKTQVGLFSCFQDEVLSLAIKPLDGNIPFVTFDTPNEGKEWLAEFCDFHQLCPAYCTHEFDGKPCLNYQDKKCKGICIGSEDVSNYNLHVQHALDTLGFFAPNAIIFDHGRRVDELSFVVIEKNEFKGFGWIDKSEATANVEQLSEYFYSQKPNADAKAIINGYMAKNKVVKIIRF